MGEGQAARRDGEALAHIETARSQLEDAELVLREGRHALCVLLSAMSAENASSALLLVAGAKPSRRHRNSLVLRRLAGLIGGELGSLLGRVADLLRRLEPHINHVQVPHTQGDRAPPSRPVLHGGGRQGGPEAGPRDPGSLQAGSVSVWPRAKCRLSEPIGSV